MLRENFVIVSFFSKPNPFDKVNWVNLFTFLNLKMTSIQSSLQYIALYLKALFELQKCYKIIQEGTFIILVLKNMQSLDF